MRLDIEKTPARVRFARYILPIDVLKRSLVLSI